MAEYVLKTKKLALTLEGHGLVRSARIASGELLTNPSFLFVLTIDPWGELTPDGFTLEAVQAGNDGVHELLSVTYRHKTHPVALRGSFMTEKDGVRFCADVSVDWPETPEQTFIHFPWLSDLSCPGAEFRYPANPVEKPDGSGAMQLHPAFPLPLCFYDGEGNGLSMRFDIAWPGLGWSQVRNLEMNAVANHEGWTNHRLRLRPHRHFSPALDVRIDPLSGGWPEAFSTWRKDQQALMDLTEYRRKDTAWVSELPLHHFTYVYGKEACGNEQREIDLDALIKAGEEFGGYDALLLWHQYPRLGLDNRSQWDFFDDFPGGREGLKDLSRRAHDRGVRVFLPFKPWDAGYDETPREAVVSMAKLVVECEIDGIFFDTMDQVPEGLRELIDAQRPGVAFCTEGQPANRRCLEMITCSWDQYWNELPMPEVNLLRFLLPSHATLMISRWHVGVRKDLLIRRAVFGGTGIVIWQDIFGAWLPYSERQKAEIARWKRIWLEYRDCFTSPDSIPLYPTSQAGLYANLFPGAGRSALTLYNAGESATGGALARLSDAKKATEIWECADICLQGGVLHGEIPAGAVWVILLNDEETI